MGGGEEEGVRLSADNVFEQQRPGSQIHKWSRYIQVMQDWSR